MNQPPHKHPCPDCRQCQWCSDERCQLCLKSSTGGRRKLSIAEQIELYESRNGKNDREKPRNPGKSQ